MTEKKCHAWCFDIQDSFNSIDTLCLLVAGVARWGDGDWIIREGNGGFMQKSKEVIGKYRENTGKS